MNVHSDTELVAQAREGCQEAFGELIKRHYKTWVNMATFMLRDRAEALDEVQKACWKAFVHFDQYRSEAEFSTWMLRIVENQCRMLLRVKKRAQLLHIDSERENDASLVIELPALGTGLEEGVIDSELRAVLQMEIQRIPRLLRNVLLLRDVQELPMKNVAERLNITVPAAKSRLRRARRELKARVLRQSGGGWYNRPVPKLQRPSLKSGTKWMS
jgi:RNA polymerase sigma-70 factor (ECF subfamily)